MISEGKGQLLYKRAKEIIPGGTQLLSKRPEMFLPDQWPAYYSSAEGCEVTDLDGNTYLDFSLMGVGSCILGYNDPDVSAAVIEAIKSGNMATLNVPEEVELAELLLGLHPWADMVRYARTGGEAMSIAVRLARAASGNDVVLFSGYHGWSDWYIAANIADDASLDGHLLSGLQPAGVPRTLNRTAVPFRYNDVEAFNSVLDKYNGKIGAIVVESIRNDMPTSEFLEAIHNAAGKHGIPLIVDEITAGFRLNIGGAHLVTGWNPDISGICQGHEQWAPNGCNNRKTGNYAGCPKNICKQHILDRQNRSRCGIGYNPEDAKNQCTAITVACWRNRPDRLEEASRQISDPRPCRRHPSIESHRF